jgi:hypothetical protein
VLHLLCSELDACAEVVAMALNGGKDADGPCTRLPRRD